MRTTLCLTLLFFAGLVCGQDGYKDGPRGDLNSQYYNAPIPDAAAHYLSQGEALYRQQMNSGNESQADESAEYSAPVSYGNSTFRPMCHECFRMWASNAENKKALTAYNAKYSNAWAKFDHEWAVYTQERAKWEQGRIGQAQGQYRERDRKRNEKEWAGFEKARAKWEKDRIKHMRKLYRADGDEPKAMQEAARFNQGFYCETRPQKCAVTK